MLTLNGTLIVQVVNFIVFLAIMNVIFFGPVGRAIARRRAYIDGLADDIAEMQHDIRTLRGQADERRAVARREADEAIARERVEIARESDAIVTQAQGEAAQIAAKAQLEVAREVEAARTDEARIVDALASEMLVRAVGGAA
jgi:F-type H+-transporting ATPase subunit b